jgi:soluble cytochrome b562
MKHIPLLITIALLVFPTFLQAQADSPLEGQMKILARGMRQLTQQVADPAKQQENIILLETLKKAVTDSKTLEPRKTASIPADKRDNFLSDYRQELDELSGAFDQVEEAVKAGQYDKAKSLLATVNSIKKEGHGKFKVD